MINKLPKAKNEHIVVQESGNELLIYDLQTNKAFCLNETSAMVYQLCDGEKSVSDIKSKLNKRLNQPINEDLIWLALDGLNKENLLENNEEFQVDYKGLSRRQVIKKVGFTSMIALPLISSLVAPTAAATQSCLSTGAPAPGTTILCGLPVSNCNSICNNSNGSQCCNGAQASNQVSCDPPNTCTCVCV